MSERFARPRPGDSTPTGDSAGRTSDFERLAPEIRGEAYRRLSGVAFVYAATFLIIFLIEWIVLLRQRGTLCSPGLSDNVRSLVAIGGAVAVWLAARRERIPAGAFLRFAILFEIFGAYGIVGGLWGWPFFVEEYLRTLIDSGADLDYWAEHGIHAVGEGMYGGGHITWASIWVLIFPLIVPMPRRKAVLASFLTASVLPAVLIASQLWHGVPDLVRPHVAGLWIEHLVPAYLIAAMASYGSTIAFGLTRDLSKARQLGAYRLEEMIGKGGMGEVWRASHRMLARPAAVKLIRPEALGGSPGSSDSGSSTARRRFEREAQATAALSSPHTIELYDFGVSDEGTFYYVMELLDGIDLKTLVDRYGPQPAARVVRILLQACHSLADAHATGLVHRDVKPANVFVCRRGLDCDFVKVLDFGLVKEIGDRSSAGAQITVEGVTSGTPAFMAPEMATGAGDVDGRADLYALGCVAYWLLTGRHVFAGENAMAVLVQHVRDEPPPPSSRTEIDVPASLERLVLDLLAKDREARPADALAVRDRLLSIETEVGAWNSGRAERWWATHQPATVGRP